MIDGEYNTKFTYFAFEYFLGYNQRSPDLWRLFEKFSKKRKLKAQLARMKVLRRTSKYCPREQHTACEFLVEVHQQSKHLTTELGKMFEEVTLRMKFFGVAAHKVWEIYFKLLINQLSRTFETPEFEEDLNSLVLTIQYFNQLNAGRKDYSYEERKSLASIYRSYLGFAQRVDAELLEKGGVIEICENLVRISGNEPKNWLFYVDTLKKHNKINVRDPIVNIYKRAIRFCKGDTSEIVESFKEFIYMYCQDLSEIEEANTLYQSVNKQATNDGKHKGSKASKIEVHKEISEVAEGKLKNMKDLYEKNEVGEKTLFIKGFPIEIDRSGLLAILPNVRLDNAAGESR